MEAVMKKILYALTSVASLSICCTVAHAANGDIAGTTYNTDILTQCNGYDIQACAIDGQTLITLEDLRFFGYSVNYVDSERALYINSGGQTSYDDLEPLSRGTTDGVKGFYYESDIKAYVNGRYIRSYALDGTSAVIAEELGSGKYGFSYDYDDSRRLLSLISTEGSVTYDELFGLMYHPISTDNGYDSMLVRLSIPNQESARYYLNPRTAQYNGKDSVKAIKFSTDEMRIYMDAPINGGIRLAYTDGVGLSETTIKFKEQTEQRDDITCHIYKFETPISYTYGFLNLYIGNLYDLSVNSLSWDGGVENGFSVRERMETEDYTILLGSRPDSRYNSLLYVISKQDGTRKELLSLLRENEKDLAMVWSCGTEDLSIDASERELSFKCEYPEKNLKCKYDLKAGELTVMWR